MLGMSEATPKEFRALRSHGVQENSEVREVLDEHRQVALIVTQPDDLDQYVSHQAALKVETLL